MGSQTLPKQIHRANASIGDLNYTYSLKIIFNDNIDHFIIFQLQ
jgi:hypothetical protein